MTKNCLEDTPKGCKNTKVVRAIEDLLTEMQNPKNTGITPISPNDLEKTKNALKIYLSECSRCASQGNNDYQCHRNAKINLLRRLPIISKSIYPWKNYDWNYSNHIDNNYHPDYTGANREGSIAALYQNTNALVKLVNGLISDSIPNKYSKASVPSWDSDYPSVKACTSPGCKTAQSIKMDFKQKKPYNHTFLNNNLDGINSSSYYYQFGTCPRYDIKTMKACEDRGFTWVPDVMSNSIDKSIDFLKGVSKSAEKNQNKNETEKQTKNNSGFCHQPRYGFIDNTPKSFIDGSNLKGIIPSLANDLASLTPDKIFSAMMGASNNSLVLQQCPNTSKYIEDFNFSSKNRYDLCYLLGFIIFLIVIIYITKSYF